MKPILKFWQPAATGEPSVIEVLLMATMTFTVHLATLCRVKSFWTLVAGWPDNPSYLDIAGVIRNWHHSAGEMPHHFWGFPYAIMTVSRLFFVPELMALVAISMLGSLVVCALVHRLYGGWVAAAFVLVNYEWITLSIEGGSEPLFMCLLFASFLAFRSGRWNLAAVLAALATTVRPLGVFALISFAIVLAARRSFRHLAGITLVGLAIGTLYVLPVWSILGSPLANFSGYSPDWGQSGWPVTYPLGGLVPAYMTAFFGGTRWYTLIFIATWPVFAIVGLWNMGRRERSENLWFQHRAEAIFVTLYTLFFISYSYSGLAWYFSRFLIPVVPLLLYSLRQWIPKDRRLLWGAAVVSALLSSAAMVGFRNVFGFRLG